MKDSLISKVMAEMGRKGGKAGGKKGGRARMAAMSSEERSALARKAAQARWGTKSKKVTEIATETIPEAAGSPRAAGGPAAVNPISASGIERVKEVAEAAAAAAAGVGTTSPVSAPVPSASSAAPSPAPSPLPEGGEVKGPVQSPTPSSDKPAAPTTAGFSPVSENLVAARVNAGKHYDGIDWSEDPKPAGPEEAEAEGGPERIRVREELEQVLASLVAELETGVDSAGGGRGEDAVAEALRGALEKTRGATAALPGIRPKEEDQIRQTLFLLDEVRMTLGDDRAISLRSARKALKLWAGPEDRP